MITQKRFNWKVFLVLWLAAIFGVIAVLPYTLTLQAPVLEKTKLPIPLEVLLPIQVAQNAVIFTVAVAAGLFFAYRIGLGAPILEAFFARDKIGERVKAILVPSIALGVLAAIAIVAVEVLVFVPALQAELGEAAKPLTIAGVQPPAWQGLLASFYGGIDEEIFMRLLLLSLFAWLGKFVSHTADGRPTLVVLWVANILVAILFGLGHLPATSLLIPLRACLTNRWYHAIDETQTLSQRHQRRRMEEIATTLAPTETWCPAAGQHARDCQCAPLPHPDRLSVAHVAA